jgi:hypothetical protein
VRIRAPGKGFEGSEHIKLTEELSAHQTADDKLHTLIFGKLQEDLQGELDPKTKYKVTVAGVDEVRGIMGADLVRSNAIVKKVLEKTDTIDHELKKDTKILRLMAANHMAFREELMGSAMPPHHTQVITALLSTQVRPVVAYLLKHHSN